MENNYGGGKTNLMRLQSQLGEKGNPTSGRFEWRKSVISENDDNNLKNGSATSGENGV